MSDNPLIDTSRFPVVVWRSSQSPEGYSHRWIAEMNQLLARGERFVMVFPEPNDGEAHSDRKARSQWLKANRATFARVCVAIFAVEPDVERRARRQAQAASAGQAFGTVPSLLPNESEAFAEANRVASSL